MNKLRQFIKEFEDSDLYKQLIIHCDWYHELKEKYNV